MRKLNLIKKILCAVLATAMLFGSVSCKEQNSNSSNKGSVNFSSQKIENYFIAEPMEQSSALSYVSKSGVANGKTYLIGQNMDAGGGASETICFMNKSTGEVTQLELPEEIQNSYGARFIKDKIYVNASNSDWTETSLYELNKDGSVSRSIKFEGQSGGVGDYFVKENGEIVALYMDYSSMTVKTSIKVYDAAGAEIKSTPIEEIIPDYKSNMNSQFISIEMDQNGNVYLLEATFAMNKKDKGSSQIYELGSDLTYKDIIKDITVNSISSIQMGSDNNMFLIEYDYNSEPPLLMIDEIDLATKTIKGQYEIENMEIVYEGDSTYDCYYYKENAIYGYNFASGEEVKIQDLVIESENSMDNFNRPTNVSVKGDEIFYTAYLEAFSNNEVCIIMNEDGFDEAILPITPQNGGYINQYNINEDGTISFVENAYVNENEPNFYIHTMDMSGAITSTIDLKELNFSNHTYLSSFVKDKDGNFIISTATYDETSSKSKIMIYSLDPKGKLLFEIEAEDILSITNIIKMKNNDIILSYFGEKESGFAKLNTESKSLDKDYKIEGLETGNYYEIINGNDEYEFFVTEGVSVSGYDSKKKELVEIINFIDSDIEGSVQSPLPVSKDKIICQIYNEDSWKSGMPENTNYILKRADAETLKKVQEKQILTAAGNNVIYNLSSEVVKFNKSNDKFRVKVIDYSKFNTEDDYNAGSRELNNDLLKGNVPDILLLNTEMNADTYIGKKLLTDMNAFFSSDKEIKKEDYLENILNIFESDGKLYQITPTFGIRTMVGKTSEIGEKQGWNFSEFMAFVEKNKDKEVLNISGRKELLNSFLSMTIGEYVNYKEGKCNFENEDFIKLMEFVKEYGKDQEDIDIEAKDSYPMNEYNALLNIVGIDRYQTLHELEKGYIGEEITFKGLPSPKGIGSAIAYEVSLAISDKSKNKEGAWEFVKVFLKEDFQDKIANTGWEFPLKKSSLEKLAENTKNPPKDQGYSRIEPTIVIGDEPKEIGFIDDAGIEKVNKLITSIDSAVNYDANISKIIEEEMEVFYKGDKTAQEVAKLIQNRVNTYINEIK